MLFFPPAAYFNQWNSWEVLPYQHQPMSRYIQSQKTICTPCHPVLHQLTQGKKSYMVIWPEEKKKEKPPCGGSKRRSVYSKVEYVQSLFVSWRVCPLHVHPTHNPNEFPGLQNQPLCHIVCWFWLIIATVLVAMSEFRQISMKSRTHEGNKFKLVPVERSNPEVSFKCLDYLPNEKKWP